MNRSKTLIVLVTLLFALFLMGCGNKNGEPSASKSTPTPEGIQGQILGFWRDAEDPDACGILGFIDDSTFYEIGMGIDVGQYSIENNLLTWNDPFGDTYYYMILEIDDTSMIVKDRDGDIIYKLNRLMPLSANDKELKQSLAGLWKASIQDEFGNSIIIAAEYSKNGRVVRGYHLNGDLHYYALGNYKLLHKKGIEEIYPYTDMHEVYMLGNVNKENLELSKPCGGDATYQRIAGFPNLAKKIVGTWREEPGEDGNTSDVEITFFKDGTLKVNDSSGVVKYEVMDDKSIIIFYDVPVVLSVMEMRGDTISMGLWEDVHFSESPDVRTYIRK